MSSKRIASLSVISSLILTLVMPFIAVRVVGGEAGFAFVMLQFYWVNPILAAINGAVAGKDIKANWILIFYLPIIFIASSMVVFGAGASEFTSLSARYLAVGAAAMLLVAAIRWIGSRREAKKLPERQSREDQKAE